jgi:hypothetical protein
MKTELSWWQRRMRKYCVLICLTAMAVSGCAPEAAEVEVAPAIAPAASAQVMPITASSIIPAAVPWAMRWQRIEVYTDQGSIPGAHSLLVSMFASGKLTRSLRTMGQDDAPPVEEINLRADQIDQLSMMLGVILSTPAEAPAPESPTVIPPGSQTLRIEVLLPTHAVTLDSQSADQVKAVFAKILFEQVQNVIGKEVFEFERAADRPRR